ncbi:hypothetical protein DFH06DRAFT_1149369 [Mycena polygramma]|nr:hypothetical protein DFH06DRAFT_1149369 [Mycena polygramma]
MPVVFGFLGHMSPNSCRLFAEKAEPGLPIYSLNFASSSPAAEWWELVVPKAEIPPGITNTEERSEQTSSLAISWSTPRGGEQPNFRSKFGWPRMYWVFDKGQQVEDLIKIQISQSKKIKDLEIPGGVRCSTLTLEKPRTALPNRGFVAIEVVIRTIWADGTVHSCLQCNGTKPAGQLDTADGDVRKKHGRSGFLQGATISGVKLAKLCVKKDNDPRMRLLNDEGKAHSRVIQLTKSWD